MQSSPYEFVAIAIVEGENLTWLQEALLALSIQRPKCFTVVITQSSTAFLPEFNRICKEIEDLGHVLLCEPDISQNTSCLLNLGLNYCYHHDHNFKFVFFLKDGDLIYPFFTLRMLQFFSLTGADVICFKGNCHQGQGLVENVSLSRAIVKLFSEDAIPGNSSVISLKFLKKHRIFFDEGLVCQASRKLLLQLLQKGARFEYLDEIMSEFEDHFDENTAARKKHYIAQASSAISLYIRNTDFIFSGDVMAGIAPLIREYRGHPPHRPRSQQVSYVIKNLKRLWKKLPLNLKNNLKNGYIKFTRVVDTFWDA